MDDGNKARLRSTWYRVGARSIGATPKRYLVVIGALIAAVIVAVTLRFSESGSAEAQSDKSPVNLSTPVVMARGVAHKAAIVRIGHARIEVLSPTLLRLEYSPSDNFEDDPTVNAIDRRMPVPKFKTRTSGGWLTLETSSVTFRYRFASGPFTAADTSMQYMRNSQLVSATPTWDWECPFDQTCQAGAAVLRHGAVLSFSQAGYQSSSGYIGGLVNRGASATWRVLGAPRGRAELSVRYSAVPPSGESPRPQSVSLTVNGRPVATLAVPPTSQAQPWSTIAATASLDSASDSVGVECDAGDSCDVDVDSLSVGSSGAAVAPLQIDPLGGWIRGWDTYTYASLPTCAPGTSGSTCQNNFEPLHPGLLDGAGWRLLDDTQSAVWTDQGWVRSRPPNGDQEDGYLFAYGLDYSGALRTFARLTGPAPLLPRNVFGVWFSNYTPYSASSIENSVYRGFQENGVPLNTLSLDTDWKSPNSWAGWEWNSQLFPHPRNFLTWAHSNGIDVTLNIHSSISVDDPQIPVAQSIAGNSLTLSPCTPGLCRVWDWSLIAQAQSNFALQQSFERQGVAFWWLDWCCDNSTVNLKGLTPDAWIGHLYAQEMVNSGERGFVLARIGSSNGNPQREYPSGPWSDHTSAIEFTGDAWGTWSTLAQEVAYTPSAASIGEPYVSDDIGSYLGPPPGGPDPADLYDRWVQFGTFQPLLRLHSNNENRLPWQYPQPVRDITERFLRLREALIPYTYTLAAQANRDGLPMAQPLYLEYPQLAAAYQHPEEYLYGSQVLVAPVTSPGTTAQTTVWFPPGRWVDYFTGAAFEGPSLATLSVPLDRMPVFVHSGGIVPEQATSAGATSKKSGQLLLEVFPGGTGTLDLYSDRGTGLGYTRGEYATTRITDSLGPAGQSGSPGPLSVEIAAAHGRYPGKPRTVSYEIDLVDVTRPTEVSLNNRVLPETQPGSTGWHYDASASTIVLDTPPLSTQRAARAVVSDVDTVNHGEPTTSS